jgi:hypothetical protein
MVKAERQVARPANASRRGRDEIKNLGHEKARNSNTVAGYSFSRRLAVVQNHFVIIFINRTIQFSGTPSIEQIIPWV